MNAFDVKGTGIWDGRLRWGDGGHIREAAAELDELGYSALWFPDAGGDIMEASETLLAATRRAVVATGILNVWLHDATQVAERMGNWSDDWRGRFVLGLGISHGGVVEPERYRKQLGTMRAYLDALDSALTPVPAASRVLAALGPKMLGLARDHSAGAHPYNVTPEHTVQAREILGADRWLAPEQAVVLEQDPATARQLGRGHLAIYLGLPNYTNNLRRFGFTDDDFADGGSDRLVDAVVIWGDVDAIAGRVKEHRDAGADHVGVQVITADSTVLPRKEWRELAPALLDS